MFVIVLQWKYYNQPRVLILVIVYGVGYQRQDVKVLCKTAVYNRVKRRSVITCKIDMLDNKVQAKESSGISRIKNQNALTPNTSPS